jgi:hypothetical protein
MKKVIVFLILLCILYFIGGYIAVKLTWIDINTYNQFAIIAGGLASILGLLSFVLPRFSTNDIKSVELDALKKLTKTAEEIQNREVLLNQKESDIKRLELQKKEMEFLVRKASLSLFLKEQYESKSKRITELVDNTPELKQLLEDSHDLKTKIGELEIEINESDNSELLREIIKESKSRSDLSLLPSPFKIINELAKALIVKMS